MPGIILQSCRMIQIHDSRAQREDPDPTWGGYARGALKVTLGNEMLVLSLSKSRWGLQERAECRYQSPLAVPTGTEASGSRAGSRPSELIILLWRLFSWLHACTKIVYLFTYRRGQKSCVKEDSHEFIGGVQRERAPAILGVHIKCF